MIKKLSQGWRLLNRSIYTGERLKENLLALTVVSIFTAVLGLVLMIADLLTNDMVMFVTAVLTFLSGVGCAYLAGVQKNRERAALIPTFFCIFAFTIYTVNGFGEGTAMLWSLLAPIGLCYFVSVRNGILVSLYYTLFFFIFFYSPLKAHMQLYYSDAFLMRFPLLYASMSAFTAISMTQYHRGVLLENEYMEKLNAEVARQTEVAESRARKIEQMSFQTIQTLANAIDAKDPYTKGHSTRVSQYSVLIAQTLGWEDERVNDLRYSAMLHDIGKIGVPDSILNNPKRLTDMEYSIIKSHTVMGGDILKNRIMIESAEDVARSHHERFDGRGYPAGLKGDEISEEARIVAIADAFDAMSSNRIYRKACDFDYIRNELHDGRGKQFDPCFTDVFIDLWDRGLLDGILQSGPSEDNGPEEVSSALLKEVMDTFMSQSFAEERDIITGLMNRGSGETAIARRVSEQSGAFAFFDLDNLKVINDINGHDAGDRALRLMGDTLRAHSADGICCRMGGDEFLLFLPGVSAGDAEERIREIIADFEAGKAKAGGISAATLSVGIVMCTPAESYAQIFHQADKALYHVKQNGKNGYSFYNNTSGPAAIDQVDLGKLVSGIHNSGSYEGVMDVEYRQFAKLYEYVSNLSRRFSHPFKLVMITLIANAGEQPLPDELDRAMYFMEQSIRQAIRNVDVLTRYNQQCFLVILIGADPEGVRIALARIFRGYYKMIGSSAFSPSYSVAEVDDQT
ncbi:MAG: diguanylate cyclase [Clostridia bacterium]|nr:diguanylate cyclase [Clostridia bacterium]